MFGFFIAELAAIHLQEMACSRQRLADSGKVGVVGGWGNAERGQAMRLSRVLADLVEFALQVLLCDLHIPQGHADVFVAEQLHQCWETDAEAEHFRGVGVAEPVRSHTARATRSFSGVR